MTMKYIIAVIMVMSVFSCRKKEFPKDSEGASSDFYFEADIDNAPVKLKAGEGGYYMYSTNQVDTSIRKFNAELKTENCTNCASGIKISINDYRLYQAGDPVYIDSALKTGSYQLSSPTGYYVKFKSLFNKTATSYYWNFGDNTESSEADPQHIYSSPGRYKVSLRVRADNNCEQYIINTEKIGDNSSYASISSKNISANKFQFNSPVADTAKYDYFWQFGDGVTSNLKEVQHQYSIPGTYQVKLTLVKKVQGNDTIQTRCNVATLTTPMPCLSNYSIQALSANHVKRPLSGVVIQYTDENGEVYSSVGGTQPALSSFVITGVDNYEANEQGEKTKQFTVIFDCVVYNGSKSKHISNGKARLCISYPN